MKRRSCRTRASPSTATAGLAKADDAGTCVQDAEPATRPRKRTKTTQEVTRMVEQEQTELEELHVERADFMELPLEIVFEVLGHMRPQELLLLARMSKPLRDILMHRRTGASIWKAAFANCPDIPACPPDLNGPQYANLLFCNLCHICLGPNPKTFWRLRVRYCSHCTYEKATDENEVPSVGSAYVMSEWYGRGRALVGIPGYAVGDLSLFKSILPALTKEGKRRALLKDVNARLNRIDKHAWACKEWTRKQREKRSRELARIRHRRLAEIVQRLANAGHELGAIRKSFEFVNNPRVKQSIALTESEWERIAPELVSYVEKQKAKAQKAPYKRPYRSRVK